MQINDGVKEDAEKELNRLIRLRRQEYKRVRRDATAVRRNFVDFGDVNAVTIAGLGDYHVDAKGTDLDRIFSTLRFINETPNVYGTYNGDFWDNWVIGKLKDQAKHTSMSVEEAWVLVTAVADEMGKSDKFVAICEGNHDLWTTAVAGFSPLRELIKRTNPKALYGTDEVWFDVRFNGRSIDAPVLVRHKYKHQATVNNPVNGIVKYLKGGGGMGAVIAFGGHIHTGVYYASFKDGRNRTCYAVQCGTFKDYDPHAVRQGFLPSNGRDVAAVVLTRWGNVITTDTLEAAAHITAMYNGTVG